VCLALALLSLVASVTPPAAHADSAMVRISPVAGPGWQELAGSPIGSVVDDLTSHLATWLSSHGSVSSLAARPSRTTAIAMLHGVPDWGVLGVANPLAASELAATLSAALGLRWARSLRGPPHDP
jgi:hypothetical protein